jgi:hypothetical protein
MQKGIHIPCIHLDGLGVQEKMDLKDLLFRRKTKRLKKAVGPIVEAKKTKMLAEIDDSESDSDDIDNRLLKGMTILAMPKR